MSISNTHSGAAAPEQLPIRFGVLSKGLLIVCLPLAFEFIFFAVLLGQIAQLEKEMTREYHAKKVLQLLAHMTEIVYEVASNAAQLSGGNEQVSAQFKQGFEIAVEQIPKYRNELIELIKDNPKDVAAFKPIDVCYGRALVLFRNITQNIDKGMDPRKALEAFEAFHNQRDSLLISYSGSLKTFIAHYRYIEKSSPETQKRLRDQQKFVLLCGLLMNFLIAVVLVLFFARSITNRLRIMTLNTVLLAKRLPLKPPLSGTDEIAQLDKVFHKMADELAEAAQRKEAFMSVAAHDIRSPLTAIMGNLVLFNMGTLGVVPAEAIDRMRRTEANVRKLIELINDLLEFDKLENAQASLRRESLRCEDLIDRAFRSIESMAETQEIQLDMDVHDGDVAIFADGDRIVQVLVKLLTNSINFASRETCLTVAANLRAGLVEFSLTNKSREIPAELLALAFDRYPGERADDLRKYFGTGSGLPLCKLIIEYHGGKIGVRSAEPKGIVFWFTLESCTEGEVSQKEAK